MSEWLCCRTVKQLGRWTVIVNLLDFVIYKKVHRFWYVLILSVIMKSFLQVGVKKQNRFCR